MKFFTAEEEFSRNGIPFRIVYAWQGRRYPFHQHEFIELVCVGKGYGLHTMERDSRKEVSIGLIPGDVFAVMPGQSHQYEKCLDLRLYNILFAEEFIRHELPTLGRLRSWDFLFNTDPNMPHGKIHLTIAEMLSAESILQKILMEQSLQRNCFELYIKSLLVEFLILIGRHEAVTSSSVNSEHHQKFLQTITMLEEAPQKEYSIDDLARHAAMSVSTYSRRFQEITGLSPMNYLQLVRLEKVRSLLMTTELSISELACGNGFYDCSHLIRAFRAHFSLTPAKYRKAFQSVK